MDLQKIFEAVKEFANARDVIDDTDIVSLVKLYNPLFNESYKSIFIKKLVDNKIIYCYNANVYKAYRGRKQFVPYQNILVEKQLLKYSSEKQLKISYFDSSFYNSLSSLQSMKNYLFVGVESYAVNYLVDKITKDKKEAITASDFIKLRKLFTSIAFTFDYVIKTINVDTPLFKKNNENFYYPKIETLLVDLITDKALYDLYSSEVINIYTNALKTFSIKINTLLRYANKKGAEEKIKSLLKYIGFDIARGEFNYD